MSMHMLISIRPGEARAALLDDGRMTWFDFVRTLYDIEPPPVGAVFLARVRKVEPGLQAAFVELAHGKTAMLAARDARPRQRGGGSLPPIETLVHEGEAVIVQISRAAREGKGPRVTADPALPGMNGRQVHPRRGGETPLWAEIEAQAQGAKPPALLWQPPAPDPSVRLWQAAPVVPDVIEVDHEGSATALGRAVTASGREVEVIVSRTDDLFSDYGLDEEVDGLSAPAITLKGGGSLIIERAAALTAIDVNAGSALGSTAEDTALKVNLEAAREIPRQMALRRLGGIVVIDFLRMKAARHRRDVLATLQRGLEKDRIKASAPGFGRAGLVELVLTRAATPLHDRLRSPCPRCGGQGDVPDLAGRALALLARIVREARGTPGPLEARAAPEVIAWLEARAEGTARDLERFAVTGVTWRAEPGWPPERIDVRPRQTENRR